MPQFVEVREACGCPHEIPEREGVVAERCGDDDGSEYCVVAGEDDRRHAVRAVAFDGVLVLGPHFLLRRGVGEGPFDEVRSEARLPDDFGVEFGEVAGTSALEELAADGLVPPVDARLTVFAPDEGADPHLTDPVRPVAFPGRRFTGIGVDRLEREETPLDVEARGEEPTHLPYPDRSLVGVGTHRVQVEGDGVGHRASLAPLAYGARMGSTATVTALVDEMVEGAEQFGTTYAVAVLRAGDVVAERYCGTLPHSDRPDETVGPDTRLLSWSVAKSVLHAAVGVLVGEGRLDPGAPVGAPEWTAPGDRRGAITVEHLLAMRDGLAFTEDYVDADASDVIDMLFGSGRHDVARFAADRPLVHEPGTYFNYSSGASNIVARGVGALVGPGAETEEWVRTALLDPLGMDSATIRLDAAGTFVASSYVYATARDWLRFGACYLHDGVVDGRRVLPVGWVAHGWRLRSVDPGSGTPYGAHWWGLPGAGPDARYAGGYGGQRVVVCPAADLVIARFGASDAAHYPAIARWCREVIAAVGPAATVGT